MLSHRVLLLAVAVALSGCAVARPILRRPAPAKPVPAAGTSALNTAGPWRIATSYAPRSVTIATHAVVVIYADTSARTDTLDATLGATYAWTPPGRRRASGTLTDYRVSAGGVPAAVPPGLALGKPFTVEASPADGVMAFRTPAESSACTDPALSVLQGLHEAWIPLPETLTIGREWADTVRTVSCRDKLPMRGVSVRQFRVQRADVDDGRVVVTIDRRSKGRITAEGEQFGEPVSLGGEGNGTMQYVLDVASGQLVRASGTSWMDLAFKSRRRNQRVQQSSAVTLAWLR